MVFVCVIAIIVNCLSLIGTFISCNAVSVMDSSFTWLFIFSAISLFLSILFYAGIITMRSEIDELKETNNKLIKAHNSVVRKMKEKFPELSNDSIPQENQTTENTTTESYQNQQEKETEEKQQ